MIYWTYILTSRKAKKSYVGHTNNLAKRLQQHNSGHNEFTKKFIPWEILHTEEFTLLDQAIEREKYLKSRNGRRFIKKLFEKV